MRSTGFRCAERRRYPTTPAVSGGACDRPPGLRRYGFVGSFCGFGIRGSTRSQKLSDTSQHSTSAMVAPFLLGQDAGHGTP